MKMKSGVSEKSKEPGNEFLALFSKLTGPGIAGFTYSGTEQKQEITKQEKDILSAGNKRTKVAKFCQDQQNCQKQVNSQPGKNHNCYASIDLWFYLSPQS